MMTSKFVNSVGLLSTVVVSIGVIRDLNIVRQGPPQVQNSSFCLILPITRPKLLWKLK